MPPACEGGTLCPGDAMKVLIIEDQTRLGQFLKQGLSESRYTVTWARNCAEANDAIAESTFDVVVLDLGLLSHTVMLDGNAVELTNREYALLEVFMHNQGRVLPRTLIAEKIWASHYDVDTNLLDVYMSRLRSKLETASGRTVFKTVRG